MKFLRVVNDLHCDYGLQSILVQADIVKNLFQFRFDLRTKIATSMAVTQTLVAEIMHYIFCSEATEESDTNAFSLTIEQIQPINRCGKRRKGGIEIQLTKCFFTPTSR